MKIVLAGTTGFVGQEVLAQCVAHPSITSIIVLSRRALIDLAAAQHPKVAVHILEDFSHYPDTLLQQLGRVTACVWTLGRTPGKKVAPELERLIDVEYHLVLARALVAANPARAGDGDHRIRFVYTSGKIIERDQEKALWYMQEMRRARGVGESELESYAREHGDVLQSVITKPGLVLRKDNPLPGLMVTVMDAITVDVLAACMIEEAVKPGRTETLNNAECRRRGQAVLALRSK